MYTTNLLKTLSNTKYYVMCVDAWDSTTNTSSFTNIKRKSTSSYKVSLQNLSSSYGAPTQTKGYAAF